MADRPAEWPLTCYEKNYGHGHAQDSHESIGYSQGHYIDVWYGAKSVVTIHSPANHHVTSEGQKVDENH